MKRRALTPGEARNSKDPTAWVTFCVSAKPHELVAIDAAVDHLKAAGMKNMSRSKLLRLAFARLILDELAK